MNGSSSFYLSIYIYIYIYVSNCLIPYMIDIFLVINQTTKNLILLLMHMTRAGKGKL